MNLQPDQQIDRTLRALRDTQTPAGLEGRIAARLAQAAASNANPAPFFASRLHLSFFATAPVYSTAAIALAVLLTASLIELRHRNELQITAGSNLPVSTSNVRQTSGQPTPAEQVAAGISQGLSSRDSAVPQDFSPGSRSLTEKEGPLTPPPTDPDALALAETLAPSHPAPPMPLTAEEHLLLLATRPGQPMELAELETLRQPALQARAEAREQATIRNYIHSLLGPLSAAEAINPTPPSDDSPTSSPSSK